MRGLSIRDDSSAHARATRDAAALATLGAPKSDDDARDADARGDDATRKMR